MAVEENKGDKIHDLIGLIFDNLAKLTTSFMLNNVNANEFIEKFKSELSSLENQVSEVVKPVMSSNPAATSWPNL